MLIRHEQITGISSGLVPALCFCIQTEPKCRKLVSACSESFVCKEQFVSSREIFRLHTEELSLLSTQFVDVPKECLYCGVLVFL